MRSSSKTPIFSEVLPSSVGHAFLFKLSWTTWRAGRRWLNFWTTSPPSLGRLRSLPWSWPSRFWLANLDEGPTRRVHPKKVQGLFCWTGLLDRAGSGTRRQEERGTLVAC